MKLANRSLLIQSMLAQNSWKSKRWKHQQPLEHSRKRSGWFWRPSKNDKNGTNWSRKQIDRLSKGLAVRFKMARKTTVWILSTRELRFTDTVARLKPHFDWICLSEGNRNNLDDVLNYKSHFAFQITNWLPILLVNFLSYLLFCLFMLTFEHGWTNFIKQVFASN